VEREPMVAPGEQDGQVVRASALEDGPRAALSFGQMPGPAGGREAGAGV
jgi:hypothetical protein